MAENTIKVTDETFEKEVIKKSKEIPVVVDFGASWCGPCQILEPILESLAEEYQRKIIITKISVEGNQKKPKEYGVRSIPSVKFFKNGKVVDEFIGAIPEEQIKKWIDKNLK